jgi:hypothetical protein
MHQLPGKTVEDPQVGCSRFPRQLLRAGLQAASHASPLNIATHAQRRASRRNSGSIQMEYLHWDCSHDLMRGVLDRKQAADPEINLERSSSGSPALHDFAVSYQVFTTPVDMPFATLTRLSFHSFQSGKASLQPASEVATLSNRWNFSSDWYFYILLYSPAMTTKPFFCVTSADGRTSAHGREAQYLWR